MSLSWVLSRARVGIDAPLVKVETHLGVGLPFFNIVGLPAPVVRESRDRVRSALLNSRFEFPVRRITVNLAPVDLSKQGGNFDLPIALGLLLASSQIHGPRNAVFECFGELGLDGSLKPVRGLLTAAVLASSAGHRMIVPVGNAAEVALSGHSAAYAAPNLRIAATLLNASQANAERYWIKPDLAGAAGSTTNIAATATAATTTTDTDTDADATRDTSATSATSAISATTTGAITTDPPNGAADPGAADPGAGDPPEQNPFEGVIGQDHARRALVIAAAGGHSLLLVGPPGCGKSMLASRLPRLLPPLSRREAIELTTIHGADRSAGPADICYQAPLRAPHHTTSSRAMVGGGRDLAPGEVTLAHNGVLLLDELPEFQRDVLEALREPMERGVVEISRTAGRVVLPASFQLVATMNPCPCGHYGDPSQKCSCTSTEVHRYRSRISGPLLDRIDIQIALQGVPAEQMTSMATRHIRGPSQPERQATAPTALRSLVVAARARQFERQGKLNARLDPAELAAHASCNDSANNMLTKTCADDQLSARSWHRLLSLCRTVADLDGSDDIDANHVAEAVNLRRGSPNLRLRRTG